MGAMFMSGITDLLFSLVSVVTAGLILAGGVVAFRAVRGGAATLLMVGGGLSLLNNLVWLGFVVGRVAGVWDFGSSGVRAMFDVMRFGGTLAILMVAVAILMLGIVLANSRRQIQALEQMVATRSESGEVQ